LYNFQIQNQGWDPFIKTILRSYGGAFENYVSIREFDLARRANMNVQQVIEGLKKLDEYNILSYHQQTDTPQVTWLKPRQHNQSLYINKKVIEERKATYRKKMEAVFAYAERRICRSQQLLAYFNELNADKCGICDVCLEEKRENNATEIFDEITTELISLLTACPCDLASLVTAAKIGTEKERITTIRQLLDAGKIKFTGDKLVIS
ncbi:MAG TPA: RecQ family zinc-binding domain-containing protein, partial [Mucilaginibacter sp.]